MRDLFSLLASYNTWMNARLYKTVRELSDEQLRENKGAFFGSVLGTLNHIVVADRVWLQRFATHPSGQETLAAIRELRKPAALSEILFSDLDELTAHRTMLDEVIERWVKGLTDEDLSQPFRYSNFKGEPQCKPFSGVVLHFFNHQTHHRGQATTLLSQFGKDVGVTDLLVTLPNLQSA